ncbi:hypothetical protein [Sphingomonas aurea]|nr:hypothetical protein [Sphingomonas sp. KR1UV-12]
MISTSRAGGYDNGVISALKDRTDLVRLSDCCGRHGCCDDGDKAK